MSASFILVGSVFIFFCALSVQAFERVDPRRLCLLDGVLVGTVYFAAIPLSLMIFVGDFYDNDILGGPYRPTEDLHTTLMAFLGWATVLVAHRSTKRPIKATLIGAISPTDFTVRRHNAVVSTVVLIAFLEFLSVYFFVSAGKYEAGAHWMEKNAQFMAQSTFAIFATNLSNALRFAIFGFLIFNDVNGFTRKRTTVTLGLLLSLVDITLTFNRITFVIYLITIIIVFRQRIYAVLAAYLVAIPILATISSGWTAFRSKALSQGLSLKGAEDAILFAASYVQSNGGDVFHRVCGVFETANFQVLNAIVNNTPDRIDVLYGYTLIRPFVFWIPSTLWQGKPPVFSTLMGKAINGIEGLSLAATLFGEVYVNAFIFWPIVLFALLIGANWIFLILNRFIPAAGSIGFFVGFMLWRFDMSFVTISAFAISVFSISTSPIRAVMSETLRRAYPHKYHS